MNDQSQSRRAQTPEADAQLRVGAASAVTFTMLHEVMQPLSTALNYLGPLGRRLQEEGCSQDLVGAAESAGKSVRKATDLIRRMRSFVCEGNVETQPANIAHMVERVRSQLGTSEDLLFDLTVDCGRGAELISVDPILFELVLANLLRNAAEAVPPNGCARVSMVSQLLGDTIMIEVTDWGPGLSGDVHASLFVPTFTTKPDGSGLGLPLCRLIVEAHGGELYAGAPTPLGTTFFLTLPAAAA